MKKNKKYNIGIIGATGLVGEEFLNYLKNLEDEINQIYLFASNESKNKKYIFLNQELLVKDILEINFDDLDICFFCATDYISQKYISEALKKRVIVIDNSKVFRMDKNVPLIVPEININEIKNKRLIANPNCATIEAVIVLNKLKKFKIKRVIYHTMQSVSGSGKKGLLELKNTKEGIINKLYDFDISKTVIPYIGKINEFGYSEEEEKMIEETKKILKLPKLRITATTNRVPISYCHGINMIVEFRENVNIEMIKEALKTEEIELCEFPNSISALSSEKVFVGRIREDISKANSFMFYLVSNNIKRGAAYNAYLILKSLIITRKI